MDLSLYDTQPGQVWGTSEEFFSGARIDNQVHCFTGLQALIAHSSASLQSDKDVSVLVVFDHEEVGSGSTHGAGSPIIKEVVERVNECFGISGSSARGGGEAFKMSLRSSFVMSADVAHGIHPNYAVKHEKNHGPMLNAGTVIKTNSNQVQHKDTRTFEAMRFSAMRLVYLLIAG
jgi:aspartyl aminopeptidase